VLATDLETHESQGEGKLSWIDRQPDLQDHYLPGAATERREFMTDLECAINRLPAKMGEAFRMRELQGRSTEEITRELKISKANLWVLIHRAKQTLGESLADQWADLDGFGTRLAA
jgi:RNA polymerase sigma factor (sigma-70 family)